MKLKLNWPNLKKKIFYFNRVNKHFLPSTNYLNVLTNYLFNLTEPSCYFSSTRPVWHTRVWDARRDDGEKPNKLLHTRRRPPKWHVKLSLSRSSWHLVADVNRRPHNNTTARHCVRARARAAVDSSGASAHFARAVDAPRPRTRWYNGILL